MSKTYKVMGNFIKYMVLAIAFASILVACESAESAPLEVTIIHINDHHSHLEAQSYDLQFDEQKTRVKIGGFAEVITVLDQETEANVNPILLHAGDAMSGTVYYSLFKGESDADIMNLVKWDAFALGNHEFDDGNETLKQFLDKLEAPTVAANVVPESSSILAGAWEPYRIVEVQGQKIGIIGIDIVGKTVNSSSPGPDINFTDEVETTQKYVKELSEKKINKIIVVAHIGHNNAVDLANKVAGIDVIVTGDSHTLLESEKLDKFGFGAEGSYPTMVNSPTGEQVAIVQAWEYTKAVGVLRVAFDSEGIIVKASGDTILPLRDSFKRKDDTGTRVELEGADRDAVYKEIEESTSLQIIEPAARAITVIDKYRSEKDKLAKEIVATVVENIPGGSAVRIPQFNDADADAKWGHFSAQVVAESVFYKLKSLGTGKVDAAIQNAGGVRIPLNAGGLSVETIYTLLPFGNTIFTIELTGSEIKTALEQSIDYALSPQGSTGSFPYTAALRYDATLKNAMGSRVSNIEIQKDGAWTVIDNAQTYIIGVNNYIAGGKDGYKILGEIDDSKKVNTYIDDAQSFTDYAKTMKNISKPERTSVNLIQHVVYK